MSLTKKKEKSRDVTIRQRGKCVSIWEGTDHLLIRHHPGGGIVHLRSVKKVVKDVTHNTKPKYTKPRLSTEFCLFICVQRNDNVFVLQVDKAVIY